MTRPKRNETYEEERARKNSYSRAWRARNRDKVREANKRATDYRRNWYTENHGWMVSYNRDYHCRKKYGISYSEKMERLAAQDGKCPICGTTKPDTKHEWVVDHDHKTNAVRQILCHPCNLILGSARDDITVLQRAIDYLKKFS